MRTLRNIFLMTSLLLLTSCGWLYSENGLVKDHEYTYLKSVMGPELKIPEGMQEIQIVDEFPIPEISAEAQNYAIGEDLDNFAPTVILAVDSSSGVYTRDEKFAPTVWFRIREIKVWQALLDHLASENVPVLRKDASEGIIETDWLEYDQSGFFSNIFGSSEPRAFRHRYRFTLSKSPQGNLQLLSIQNTHKQYTGYGAPNWQDDATSRKEAIFFMNDFLGAWAQQRQLAARKKVLKANRGINLEIGQDNNENIAFIASADFQQTWVKLAKVLPKLQFDIDDKDQTLGIYFIEYNGVESASFLNSLKFWKSNDDKALPIAEGEYQLNLSAMAKKTAITLSTKEGVLLKSKAINELYPFFLEQFTSKTQNFKSRP